MNHVVPFIYLLLFLWPVNAIAQSAIKATDYRQAYSVTPLYGEMARKAMREKPPRFDFMKFRSHYSNTYQYDPIGDKALEELNALSYIAMNDPDPERVETALFAYRSIVEDHLANLGVVMQALSLARLDKRFGKTDFFEWVKEGLIRTVTISGDGYTLSGAYDVVTLPEETVLFNRLGMKLLKSQAVKEGFTYYNMHDVEDLQTGETRTLFVNTTLPMRYLEALQADQENFIDLGISRQ